MRSSGNGRQAIIIQEIPVNNASPRFQPHSCWWWGMRTVPQYGVRCRVIYAASEQVAGYAGIAWARILCLALDRCAVRQTSVCKGALCWLVQRIRRDGRGTMPCSLHARSAGDNRLSSLISSLLNPSSDPMAALIF